MTAWYSQSFQKAPVACMTSRNLAFERHDDACCSSRKGTEETATHLLAQSSRGVPGSMRGSYVRDESQKRALDAAASQVADKLLQQVILGGIGIHHGNLQPQDRSIVENLFLSWAITVSVFSEGLQEPHHFVILAGHAML